MEVITIESQAYRELITKINTIIQFVAAQQAKAAEKPWDNWVDNHEVCTWLQVSPRTLQRLRASRLVNFSLIRGKVFYRVSEIERLLNENIIRRSDEQLQNLIKHHRSNVAQKRNPEKNG